MEMPPWPLLRRRWVALKRLLVNWLSSAVLVCSMARVPAFAMPNTSNGVAVRATGMSRRRAGRSAR